MLEILYDPEIPWFKCITKSQDHEKVSRFIEELLLEIIESELAPVDPDIPGGARDEKGGLVDLDVISDDPRVVPWATYADWASARYNDYDNFRYPVALQECPHKAVWRGFEKFPESAVHDIILDFMDTISLVCGSFMVPTEVEHLGPYLGCGDVLRNLTQTLLFIGGNTQSSIDGAIGRLDNIFALMVCLGPRI